MRWRLVIESVMVYEKRPIERRTRLTIAFSRVQGYALRTIVCTADDAFAVQTHRLNHLPYT